MGFIKISSPEANIWEENPALSIITEFKQFRAKEGDEKSSTILKAIYYAYDPKSELRSSGMNDEELEQYIVDNVIRNKKFQWTKYEAIKQIYLEKNISKLESVLMTYEKSVLELKSILDAWKATKEDVDKKAKITNLYKEALHGYLEAKREVEEEWVQEEELWAGYTKSKVESYGDSD